MITFCANPRIVIATRESAPVRLAVSYENKVKVDVVYNGPKRGQVDEVVVKAKHENLFFFDNGSMEHGTRQYENISFIMAYHLMTPPSKKQVLASKSTQEKKAGRCVPSI